VAGMTTAGRGDEIAPPKTTLVQVLPPPVDGVNEREISMGANLINNNNNNNNKKIAYYTLAGTVTHVCTPQMSKRTHIRDTSHTCIRPSIRCSNKN